MSTKPFHYGRLKTEELSRLEYDDIEPGPHKDSTQSPHGQRIAVGVHLSMLRGVHTVRQEQASIND